MGIKTVFFVSLINYLFSYNLFEAANINETISIIDIIANDINACANNSIVIQSKYVKQVCNITFPDKPSDIKNENINQYLCIALYDRSVKICRSQMNDKKNLLGNRTIFDEEVNKIVNNNEERLPDVCEGWRKHSTSEYNKTKPFVDKLNSLLKYLTFCASNCAVSNSNSKFGSTNFKVNPLCAMIYYIDQKLDVIQNNNNDNNNNNSINEMNKNASVLTPKEAENDKTNKPKNIPTLVEPDTASAQKSQPNPGPVATNGDSQNIEKGNIGGQTKKSYPLNILDSGTSTIKNDGTKTNPSIQSDKTTLQINEETKIVDLPTPEKKEENNNEMAVEKPDTIDQTIINGDENNAQHPGGDVLPEDESDQMPVDDDDKITDQDSLTKPEENKDTVPVLPNMQKEDDSHFFGYFTVLGLIGIGGCLAYHHKQKILAILLEGRRSRGGRGRRRPSTASYRKLDCTLEEAVTSQCNANVTHVIY